MSVVRERLMMIQKHWWPVGFIAVLIPGTFLVPMIVSTQKAWWHQGSVGPLSEPFEIFGLCVLLAMGIAAGCGGANCPVRVGENVA